MAEQPPVEHKPHDRFSEQQIDAVAERQREKYPAWNGDFRADAIDELETIWNLFANPTPELCVEQYFRLEEWKENERNEIEAD